LTRGFASNTLSSKAKLLEPKLPPSSVTTIGCADERCSCFARRIDKRRTIKMASVTSHGHWRPGGVGHEQNAAVSSHGECAQEHAYGTLQAGQTVSVPAIFWLYYDSKNPIVCPGPQHEPTGTNLPFTFGHTKCRVTTTSCFKRMPPSRRRYSSYIRL
jgi:hypothetical protein